MDLEVFIAPSAREGRECGWLPGRVRAAGRPHLPGATVPAPSLSLPQISCLCSPLFCPSHSCPSRLMPPLLCVMCYLSYEPRQGIQKKTIIIIKITQHEIAEEFDFWFLEVWKQPFISRRSIRLMQGGRPKRSSHHGNLYGHCNRAGMLPQLGR